MWKRIHTAALTAILLTKMVLGWHLRTWFSGSFPLLTHKNGSLCLRLCSTIYVAPLLPFWESGLLLRARQRLPTWSYHKNPRHRVSTELPELATSHMGCHNLPPGELSTSRVPPWQRVPGSLHWLPRACLPGAFPSANFAPLPFTITNHSLKSNHMLSPYSKSSNLVVVLGTRRLVRWKILISY